MPIYEYACGSCEHRFETIQRASEGALRECPVCGEAALKKLLSAPNFHLKGSGWYETDFKNADKRKEAASGEAAAAEGNGKSADGATGAAADKSGEKPAAEKSGAEKSKDGGQKQAAGKAEGAGGKADSAAKSTGSSAPKTKD